MLKNQVMLCWDETDGSSRYDVPHCLRSFVFIITMSTSTSAHSRSLASQLVTAAKFAVVRNDFFVAVPDSQAFDPAGGPFTYQSTYSTDYCAKTRRTESHVDTLVYVMEVGGLSRPLADFAGSASCAKIGFPSSSTGKG